MDASRSFQFLLHDFGRRTVFIRVGLNRFTVKDVCTRHAADGFSNAPGVPGTGHVDNGNAGLRFGRVNDGSREKTRKSDGAENATGDLRTEEAF